MLGKISRNKMFYMRKNIKLMYSTPAIESKVKQKVFTYNELFNDINTLKHLSDSELFNLYAVNHCSRSQGTINKFAFGNISLCKVPKEILPRLYSIFDSYHKLTEGGVVSNINKMILHDAENYNSTFFENELNFNLSLESNDIIVVRSENIHIANIEGRVNFYLAKLITDKFSYSMMAQCNHGTLLGKYIDSINECDIYNN